MISLDLKNDAVKSSPLTLSVETDEPTISFSDLLKGIKLPKDAKSGEKLVQNGALVLALEDDNTAKELPTILEDKLKNSTKKDSLSSLLKNEDTPTLTTKNEPPVEINPKLTANLSVKELKSLMSDAKEYLKDKILQSDGYKQAQIKELPKTIKGLAQLAKKFDIDVSKITIEDVEIKDAKAVKTEVRLETKLAQVKSNIELKIEPKLEAKIAQVKTNVPNTQANVELKIETKIETKLETKLETKIAQVKTNVPNIQTNVELKIEPKLETKIAQIDTKVEIKTEIKSDIKTESKREQVKVIPIKNLANIQTQVESKTDIKTTLIFQSQSTLQPTSTEQIVQVKTNIQTPIIIKTAKEKADETLKLLLRGEKPINNNTALTADFSVASARVIAPSAKVEIQNTFESLLNLDKNDVPNDVSNNFKIDEFDVKLKEAKQMIKYLSSDVKTAIEDYKSPFTRIKVQLNPKNLGEIDLTVVQRGKNLHINLNSNNVAINALHANINELKTQLSNTGINNATFNFNSSSQNGENAQQQQNHQQKQEKANEEYNYFTSEETNEEVLSSLEIIVPQYG